MLKYTTFIICVFILIVVFSIAYDIKELSEAVKLLNDVVDANLIDIGKD